MRIELAGIRECLQSQAVVSSRRSLSQCSVVLGAVLGLEQEALCVPGHLLLKYVLSLKRFFKNNIFLVPQLKTPLRNAMRAES